MGDEQQGAPIIQQLFFQPLNGLDIQMVGRLVQQQQFGFAHQRPAQHNPPPPAAGEFGQRRIRRQLQPGQSRLHPLLQPPAILCFQLML